MSLPPDRCLLGLDVSCDQHYQHFLSSTKQTRYLKCGLQRSQLAWYLSSPGTPEWQRLCTHTPSMIWTPETCCIPAAGLENDRYVRKIDGYLPTAEVAFVDEIFKANSAILNALLTLLNERLFDNGNQRLPVPLLCLVGASNELPESEELDALYDRFLIRRTVSQVSG